ncbi:Uncharacterised protein [Klebsiella pneumoniae subsp. ozaenae]|uniref:Uncharacterized protein n=1 Tax=Klebsiella pneumoniae subsp. ozaenae TaxID=574 RepID=A0A378B209_KLEPO|nr:Uncharacterised protein [Klebsiella pneumoniae subsp. ozaenae]
MMDCIAKNMKAASEKPKQRHTVAGNGANRHAGRHDQISGHQHAAGTLFRAGESRQQDPTRGGGNPRDGGQQTNLQRSKLAQLPMIPGRK